MTNYFIYTFFSMTRKAVLSNAVLEFCYKRLPDEIPAAIRYQSAMLLGAFSSVQLQEILAYFKAKLLPVGKKNEEVLAIVPYQRAVQYLDFGFGEDKQIDETLEYLKFVCANFFLVTDQFTS